MFCWQVHEQGEWNIIAVLLDGMLTPLVTTREATFSAMRPFAEAHGLSTGLSIRGVRYDEPVVLESFIR